MSCLQKGTFGELVCAGDLGVLAAFVDGTIRIFSGCTARIEDVGWTFRALAGTRIMTRRQSA